MEHEREVDHQEKQPRGAKKRARTRADLLVAARHVFAHRGYHDATITDITEAADVGVGTFYLHFRDKDAIFNTLLEEGLISIRQHFVEKMQRQSIPSVAVAIRTLFHQAYEQRDLFRIALMGEVPMRRFRPQEMVTQLFTRFLEQAADLSPFSHTDSPLLALFISGMVLRAISWWFEQEEPLPDVMADHILSIMQHGFPASLFDEQSGPFFPLSHESTQ